MGVGGGGEGVHVWPFNEHKDFHFDKELHTHMSSEIFGANGYGHNLGVFDQLAVIILQEVGVEKKISI